MQTALVVEVDGLSQHFESKLHRLGRVSLHGFEAVSGEGVLLLAEVVHDLLHGVWVEAAVDQLSVAGGVTLKF